MQAHKRRINYTYWPISKTLYMIILEKFFPRSSFFKENCYIGGNTHFCLYSIINDYISGSEAINFNMSPVEVWYIFSFLSKNVWAMSFAFECMKRHFMIKIHKVGTDVIKIKFEKSLLLSLGYSLFFMIYSICKQFDSIIFDFSYIYLVFSLQYIYITTYIFGIENDNSNLINKLLSETPMLLSC